MMYTEATKEKYSVLLTAATGLQMVSVVSQNTDKELDQLDAYAVELLTTADDALAATLRQRLHLLRSMREEQDEVLYAGFKSSKSDNHLKTFACDIDDISLERLDRVVHNRVLGEPAVLGKELTEKLHKIQQMRRELKPVKDGVFRFLAVDTAEEAEAVLLNEAPVLLTVAAGQEILQASSKDRTFRERIDSRKKLWRKVYGQLSGKTITGSVFKPEIEPETRTDEYKEVETATSPAVTIELSQINECDLLPDEYETLNHNHHKPEIADAVTEADRLMEEVYDLLDKAIGNAMVAFSIYRENKSTRADEALKLLTELHNETKDDK